MTHRKPKGCTGLPPDILNTMQVSLCLSASQHHWIFPPSSHWNRPPLHASSWASGYYVSETDSGEIEAYAILRGLSEDSRSVELKRVVVAIPERGLGRRILRELQRITFHEFGAHRLFLDVFEDNSRARHIYESLGFRYEGIMRDAACRNGAWCNLHLMSILETEYHSLSS